MKEITASAIALVTAPAMKTKLGTDGKVAFDRWDSRPVFFLHFKDGSKLVLKAEVKGSRGEAAAARSAQWTGEMMGQVSAQVKAAALKASELTELRGLGTLHYGNNGQIGDLTKWYLEGNLGDPGNVWVKMAFVARLRDADGMLKDQKAQKLLEKLTASTDVLFQLGRIVAVDVFTGNRDRFDSTGRIVNKGNIIFTKNDDKTYTPVGLDFYEAQGDASNVYAPPPDDWDGMILADRYRLTMFASTVVKSLNELIANAVNSIDRGKLIGPQGVQAVRDGMDDGIATLRQFLLQKSQSGQALPAGVTKRMQLLGWLDGWTAPAPPRPSTPAPSQPPARPGVPIPGGTPQTAPWQRARPTGAWKPARPGGGQ